MVLYEKPGSTFFLSSFFTKKNKIKRCATLLPDFFSYHLHIRKSTPVFLAVGRLLEFNLKYSSLFLHTLLIISFSSDKSAQLFLNWYTRWTAILVVNFLLLLFMQQISCFKGFVLRILKWLLCIRERERVYKPDIFNS